ncbi:siderophore-interacting protein [Jiangella alkaliphila]|uniref:NADPH-dependent ferric siderophore reductase, contains FAD-binding and SIP domains n=1 Tax=Jiangella alkaliphila TaxID=419479 RepID=A0A1H2KYW7_9ACTN|nr:siderophore-interacting protein [Jiangella alkaliphila]SDU73538.1 NADPH-dependent ferric siderophore reductase, contains FAD-binding and SIP domains [Jiangella alkaliphila]
MAVGADLPMRFFRAEVVEARPICADMVRVVFGGPDLSGFASTQVGDEYLRIFFPPEGAEPVLPVIHPDGRWTYPDDAEPSPMRTYTVRDFRRGRGELVIDFVVHDGGVAAAWAQRAAPGDVVTVNTPTGMYDPPADLSWQLLLADAAGLPAATRILDAVPDGVRTRAVLEVPSPAHRVELPGGAGVEVVWLYGGNGHGPSRLSGALRTAELPRGSGYVWVAGETAVLRDARRYLRHELKLPPSAYKVVGYWTDNGEEYNRRLAALDEATQQWLLAPWESSADEEEQEDEYIARLESLGL